VPAVHMHTHTEALAGRGETCRRTWVLAAGGASGDRVLAGIVLTAATYAPVIYDERSALT